MVAHHKLLVPHRKYCVVRAGKRTGGMVMLLGGLQGDAARANGYGRKRGDLSSGAEYTWCIKPFAPARQHTTVREPCPPSKDVLLPYAHHAAPPAQGASRMGTRGWALLYV